MLTVVRSEPFSPAGHVPDQRPRTDIEAIASRGPAIRSAHRPPRPGARTVASDAGVTSEHSALAWVSDDGRWRVCRERPASSQSAELVALAAAVSLASINSVGGTPIPLTGHPGPFGRAEERAG